MGTVRFFSSIWELNSEIETILINRRFNQAWLQLGILITLIFNNYFIVRIKIIIILLLPLHKKYSGMFALTESTINSI